MKTSPIQTHSTFFEREVACDRLSKIILTSTPISSPLNTKQLDKTIFEEILSFLFWVHILLFFRLCFVVNSITSPNYM